MNGELPKISPVSGLRSGAFGRNGQQPDDDDRHQACRSPASRSPRDSWESSSPVGHVVDRARRPGAPAGPTCPSRGSTYLSVRSVITTAQKNVEAIEK